MPGHAVARSDDHLRNQPPAPKPMDFFCSSRAARMPAIDNISAPQRRAAAWWLGLFGFPFMAIALWLLFAGVWPALSDWATLLLGRSPCC